MYSPLVRCKIAHEKIRIVRRTLPDDWVAEGLDFTPLLFVLSRSALLEHDLAYDCHTGGQPASRSCPGLGVTVMRRRAAEKWVALLCVLVAVVGSGRAACAADNALLGQQGRKMRAEFTEAAAEAFAK